MPDPIYSVVVPVFNEEENLEDLVCRISASLESLSGKIELILVDDGSMDQSFQKIQELKSRYPWVRGLKFDRNHGQTAAMAAGIMASRGSSIVTIDADLQNDPADITKMLSELDTCDAVVGWRQRRNDSFVRRISSRVANLIRNLISQENIQDTGCSLKAFRAASIKNLLHFEGMHRFIPTLIKMHGGKVHEMPVNHLPRTRGVTKYSIMNRLFCSFADLLLFAGCNGGDCDSW